MKVPRYLLFGLVILAAAAATAWYLRDSLIRQLSGPLLAEYGFRITDISLDSLAPRDAAIGRLELVHETGTTIRVDNLRLPFRADAAGLRSYRAGTVTIITATRGDDQPFEAAAWLQHFLNVPHDLAGSDFKVDELRMPPHPPVRDLHWVLAGDTQALRATVDGIGVSLAVAETAATSHSVFVSTGGQDMAAVLSRDAAGFGIAGTSQVDLTPWAPLAVRAGLLPAGLALRSGAVSLTFDVWISSAAGASIELSGTLVPSAPVVIGYAAGGSDMSATIANSAAPLIFTASIPGSDWHFERATTALTVDAGGWRGIKLQVDDLDCRAGPVCSLAAVAEVASPALPGGGADRIEGRANMAIAATATGTGIDLQPGANLQVSGLVLEATAVDRIEATIVSAARADLAGNTWTATADSVDGQVDGVRLADEIELSLPLYLERLDLQGDDDVSVRAGVFAPASRLVLPDMAVSSPGVRGDISLDRGVIEANLATVGLHRDAAIRVRHDSRSGAGQLALDEAEVSFAARSLAERFSPWPWPFSLSAGTLSVALDAAWPAGTGDLTGAARLRLDGVAGFYDDIALTGLSTTLSAGYASQTGLVLAPADLAISLVDIGLPVENITARYALHVADQLVDVEDLRMEAFGGVVSAEPFSFRTGAGSNHLVLHAEGMDLAELLAVQEFEAIYVEGRISADLPVTIGDGGITVTGGRLSGDAPGGTIRYRAGDPGTAATGALDVATRALSNFVFDALSSGVDYGDNGDLKLQMRLSGRNPDLEGNRPVILNLSVESNIPQMLKSLRAARTVEEILEKRLVQ